MAISAKSFKKSLKENGIFYTDEALAKEMRALLPENVTDVYDPTCGDGALLKVFDDDVQKYGQDILAGQVACAQQNLTNFHGVVGDTLTAPAFTDKKFSAIIANPPFSVKWQPCQTDERFAKAPVLPPPSKADYAFILHILHYLADDGTAVVLNFPGILYRGQREGKIRKWIVENNWVSKIIHIPGGHFEDTSIATAIVVFCKNKKNTDIVFTDSEHNLSRTVPFSEVKENDYNLSVSMYVQPEVEKEDINPIELEMKARADFYERLKRELNFEKTVCEFENMDFSEVINGVKKIVNDFECEIQRI